MSLIYRLRTWVLLLLVLLSLSIPVFGRAEPCAVPVLDVAAVRVALARLRQPLRPLSAWWRVRALLPKGVAWTMRDQRYDGTGWYAGSTGTESERGLFGATSGHTVRVQWDLVPLFAPSPPIDPLQRVERFERLASRVAVLTRRILLAAAPAPDSVRTCGAIMADIVSAELALRAMLGVARTLIRWPASGASDAKEATSPSQPPPTAPSVPRPAAPRPPDRARPR